MKASFRLPLWIRQYQKADFRFDLVAGLTVAVMLVPQGMAYAVIAGLPPIYGLYASTLPAIVYALFGTSRQLSVGPGALTALLTASGIGLIAQTGTEQYLMLVTTLVLMVGLIQFLLGVSKLGFLINFLSNPVILGFTSAAAILIGLTQLKHLLGVQLVKTQHIEEIIGELIPQLSQIHGPTFFLGLGGLITIFIFQKYYPMVPTALIVVTLSIVITWLFRLDLKGIKIVGAVPPGFPMFSFAGITSANALILFPTAFAIALVSFMESTAVARTIQARHKNYIVTPNKELMALGLANMMSGLIRSVPVTGGMSRSLVNDQAGARTGMASILTSLMILLTLLFLTSLFFYLPYAILAAVIVVAISRLLKIQEAKQLWFLDRKDFWMMMATFLGTLFFGIGPGIGIGVLLSLAWIIFEASYPHHAELGRVPGTHSFRNLRRFANLERIDHVMIFRFDAPLFFANIERFREVLIEYKAQRTDPVHTIIIDMESNNSIDSSALELFSTIIDDLRKDNIRLLLAEVKGPIRDKMYRSGLTKKLGEDHLFVTVDDALNYVSGLKSEFTSSIALQTNAIKE